MIKTFQQGDGNGYAGTVDTFIDSSTPTQNNSAAVSLVADYDPPGAERHRKVLLRFDNIFGSGANQIPFGSVINSVALKVYINTEGTELGAHRLLIPWNATDNWNTFGTGISGGINQDGTDAQTVADITTDVRDDHVTLLDTYIGFRSLLSSETLNTGVNVPGSGLLSTVQAWANGATNYGWVLTSHVQGDGLQIDSSKSATQAQHPMLTIDYTPATALSGRAAVLASDSETKAGRAHVMVADSETILGRAAVVASGASATRTGRAAVGPYIYTCALPYNCGAWYRGVPPQFIRPVSDVTVGAWGVAPLYSKINESPADDETKIASPVNPSNSACEVGLQSAPSATSARVRYRFQKTASGGQAVNLTVALVQGTTIIASKVHTGIANGWTIGEFRLSEAELAAISDFTNLRLRFTAGT